MQTKRDGVCSGWLMNGKAKLTAAPGVLVFAVLFCVAGCGSRAGRAPAPKIDGDLSDACWKDTEITGDWTNVETGKTVTPKPSVFVYYDEANLYVAFFNPESDIKAVVADAVERDGSVWRDDSNEIFLDPTAKREDYYHFIVNTKGVILDGKTQDRDWNSQVTVAVKRTKDAWSLEVAIPLKDLEVTGSPKGQTWAANFCRNRMTRGEPEYQAWADTGESFHNPKAFKNLTFR